MIINTSANITDNAWVRRINELRNDLENFYSSMDCNTYAEAVEWMLDAKCDAEYDLDDATFLRKDAERLDNK